MTVYIHFPNCWTEWLYLRQQFVLLNFIPNVEVTDFEHNKCHSEVEFILNQWFFNEKINSKSNDDKYFVPSRDCRLHNCISFRGCWIINEKNCFLFLVFFFGIWLFFLYIYFSFLASLLVNSCNIILKAAVCVWFSKDNSSVMQPCCFNPFLYKSWNLHYISTFIQPSILKKGCNRPTSSPDDNVSVSHFVLPTCEKYTYLLRCSSSRGR